MREITIPAKPRGTVKRRMRLSESQGFTVDQLRAIKNASVKEGFEYAVKVHKMPRGAFQLVWVHRTRGMKITLIEASGEIRSVWM